MHRLLTCEKVFLQQDDDDGKALPTMICQEHIERWKYGLMCVILLIWAGVIIITGVRQYLEEWGYKRSYYDHKLLREQRKNQL